VPSVTCTNVSSLWRSLVNEELLYVQRKIEDQADQLRALENGKAEQTSLLARAQATAKDLEVKLSFANEELSLLSSTFEKEQHVTTEAISALKQLVDEHEKSGALYRKDLEGVRQQLAEHAREKDKLTVNCNIVPFQLAMKAPHTNDVARGLLRIHPLFNLQTFFDVLKDESSTLKKGLRSVANHGTGLGNVQATFKSKHEAQDAALRSLLQQLQAIRTHLLSVAHKGSRSEKDMQTMSTLILGATSLYHDNCSTISRLQNDILQISADHDVLLSNTNLTSDKKAAAARTTFEQQLNESNKRYADGLQQMRQTNVDLKMDFQNLVRHIVQDWKESLSDAAEVHKMHTRALSDEWTAAKLSRENALWDVTGSLKVASQSLTAQEAKLSETQLAYSAEVKVYKTEIAQLRSMLIVEKEAKKLVQDELDVADAKTKAALSSFLIVTEKYDAISSACVKAQTCKVNLSTKLKEVTTALGVAATKRDELERLRLEHKGEGKAAVARAEAAEATAGSLIELADKNDEQVRAAVARADAAEAEIIRLKKLAKRNGEELKAVVARAEAGEASLIRLQRLAENNEKCAKIQTDVEVGKLRVDNESLRADLSRAESEMVESASNLRESAQMTLNAIAKKDQLVGEVARMTSIITDLRNSIGRLTSVREENARTPCRDNGHCSAAELQPSPVEVDIQCAPEENSDPADTAIASTRDEAPPGLEILETACGPRIPTDFVSPILVELVTSERGKVATADLDTNVPETGSAKAITSVVTEKMPRFRTRKLLAAKTIPQKQVLPLVAPTPEVDDDVPEKWSKKGNFILTLAPRKSKRTGFKRPRMSTALRDSTVQGYQTTEVKPRVKRSKKAAASVNAAAASVGVEDESDWIVG
jgi:hypothetical protein